MTPDLPPEPPDDVMSDWLAACEAAGRDIPPAEFYHDRPDLTAKLNWLLRVMRQVEALMPKVDDTGDRPSAETVARVEESDSAPPADAPPGYELLGELGRGGMGVVYKAHNRALNRIEAVKVTRAGEFAGPRALARFRFEAEAAAGLDHPNVVTVYRVDEGPSGPFIAMRFVDGESLAKRAPATPRQIATLLAKVARAVHFAHQRGILHRDLKPDNILVDAAGEPFVADFGIARRLDADATLTLAGSPIGTAAYMAPEQARGDANLTVAADVYALGGVLYQLLTGRPPYSGSVPEVLRKVQSDEPPPDPRDVNSTVDPDLREVCLKCLHKNPPDRYRTAAELAEDLERFARGDPVTARPPGFFDWVRQIARTRPEPHRHYSWQVTAWFGVLVLLASVGVYLLARFGGAAIGVWAANGGCAVAMAAVLWWFMVRRFRELPPTERHSLIIAAGHVVVYLSVTAAYVPPSLTASAVSALAMYPALAACSGLGLFTLGSTNWSRFFPLGLACILAAPLLAFWPDISPLVYGVGIAAVMWYWAFTKKFMFGVPRERDDEK